MDAMRKATSESFGKPRHHYRKLDQENSDPGHRCHDASPDIAPQPWPRRVLVYNTILFLFSIIFFFLAIAMLAKRDPLSGREILRETTLYSIAIDDLTPEWRPHKFVTTPLWSKDSIFRQPPSDEVDAAWARIADLGVLVLHASDIESLGKDASTVVQAPASWGLGSDAYLGQLDGIHLLHCLNSMRKSLYHNYQYYHPNGTSAAYLTHLGHCQEALTKYLMCQPSLELITFNWVKHQVQPFPDFDITRKCWDFERLVEWQDEHRVQSINLEVWKELRRPDGVVPLRSPVLNEEVNGR